MSSNSSHVSLFSSFLLNRLAIGFDNAPRVLDRTFVIDLWSVSPKKLNNIYFL